MAVIVFTNAQVIVNAVDLSDHVTKITVKDDRAQVDVTAMGAGYSAFTKGLGTAEIDIDFLQDFATGKVHQTLQPLIGSTTPIQVEVRPVNAARSATNPALVLTQCLLFTYEALDSQIGAAAAMTATFVNAPGGPGMSYLTS